MGQTLQLVFSIQLNIMEISLGDQMEQIILCPVRPEYLRPQLKVVHFDQSGHFSALFHLTKLLSLLLLLLQNMQWLGSDKFS